MEDILALVLIFGGGACIALSFSPIGRALADRIRGKSAGTGDDELRAEVAEHKQALADELEAVRRSTVLLFKHLDEQAWSRRGVANNAEVSVRALAYIIAGHELHHRGVLESRYL